ncbi:MAG: GH25 family lysozyme [Candidatus Dormibacteria bacterium]
MPVVGYDISDYQANLPDLSGIDFIFHKCTQGASFVSQDYAGRHAAITSAGLVWGAYHFMTMGDATGDQVSNFASNAGLMAGDIVAIDFEDDGTWYQYNFQQIAQKATDVISKFVAAFPQHVVVVYFNRSTWTDIVQPYSIPLADGIWIASPGETPTMNWVFWQYGQTTVDTDYGNFSTHGALVDWSRSRYQPTPPPPVTNNQQLIGDFDMPMGAWPPNASPVGHALTWPIGNSVSTLTLKAVFSLATVGKGAKASGHVWFIGQNDSGPVYLHDEDWSLGQDGWRWWAPPNGTRIISVLVNETVNELAWSLEIFAA